MGVIVSLTSYGDRLRLCGQTIYSIIRGSYKDLKVCLTLYKDDVKRIPQDLQMMIKANLVELIIADKNLKSHLKYVYCMQRHVNDYIVTIDDDFVYPLYCIKKLVDNSTDTPMIIAHRGHVLRSYIYRDSTEPTIPIPSRRNIALGAFGVLYPPHCFTMDNAVYDEISHILHNDDVYLKVLSMRAKIPTLILNSPSTDYIEVDTGRNNLHTLNWVGRTQNEMNYFKHDFDVGLYE